MKKISISKKTFYGRTLTHELSVVEENQQFVYVRENCPGSVIHGSLVAVPKNGESVKVGVGSKYETWSLL